MRHPGLTAPPPGLILIHPVGLRLLRWLCSILFFCTFQGVRGGARPSPLWASPFSNRASRRSDGEMARTRCACRPVPHKSPSQCRL